MTSPSTSSICCLGSTTKTRSSGGPGRVTTTGLGTALTLSQTAAEAPSPRIESSAWLRLMYDESAGMPRLLLVGDLPRVVTHAGAEE